MYLFIIILILIVIGYIIYRLNYVEVYRYFYLKSSSNIQHYDKLYSKKIRVKSKQKVVISLTTIPSRINKIRPTLISLMDSTKRIDEIQINIPYKSLKGIKYKIPQWLSKLKNVKIYRVSKDYGPATKLLPTLKREKKNTIIIVVDDDVIYGSKLVETYIKEYIKKKCALTTFGAFINNKLTIQDENIPTFLRYRSSKYVDLVMGHNSFLVTPKMFTSDVFDFSLAPKECKWVDDVWFSCWLNFNNIKIWSLGNTYKTTPITNFETLIDSESLCFTHNVNSNNNNIAIKWFHNKNKIKFLFEN